MRSFLGVSLIFLLCVLGNASTPFNAVNLPNNSEGQVNPSNPVPGVNSTSNPEPDTVLTTMSLSISPSPIASTTIRTTRRSEPSDPRRHRNRQRSPTTPRTSTEGLSTLAIMMIILAVFCLLMIFVAFIVCWKKQKWCFGGEYSGNFKMPQPMKNMFYKDDQFDQVGPLTINQLCLDTDPEVLRTPDNDPPVDGKHFTWDEPGNKVYEIGDSVETVMPK
ncbi:hypothetical protein QR680_011169 [Steinernema hermaphroditum]|uniref:Uncharacterized protein n=1 Tax=Steinernema hermaphroditum TaxID=289476 RepID=A0AA39ITU6_9BILA|nr:hypothetical protein QR680_011169 [Steinernema hermaphroditum]